ncbi:nucleoside phosphorylase [Candidatus Woesearchaeota archaeon]|nr:nucleoside phosphorylase [Candidatus Woesearchaeota archaeon]
MTEPVKDSELIVVKDTEKRNIIYHLGLRPEQLARQIFVVGDPKRADLVAMGFDTVEYMVQNREFVTRTGTYQGMPVTVMSTGIGTDNNEIALIEAFGLNEFDLETRTRRADALPLTIIRLGTSGGPQRDIECGALAISSYALGLDNTGLFYDVPAADETVLNIETQAYHIITAATPLECRFRGKIHPYASKATPEVVDALIKHAQKQDVRYAVGITASASGFFGPQGREIPGLPITVPRLQEYLAALCINGNRIISLGEAAEINKEAGMSENSLVVTNFEMESSLLFHLGAQMKYKIGTICPIIANRPKGTFLADYKPQVEKCIDIGLSAMLELYTKSAK